VNIVLIIIEEIKSFNEQVQSTDEKDYIFSQLIIINIMILIIISGVCKFLITIFMIILADILHKIRISI